MSRKLPLHAWLLCCALVLVACDSPKPASAVLEASEQLQAPAQVGDFVASAVTANTVVTLWGSPQVAPSGTLRTLHVAVYTNTPQDAPQIGVSTVNITADGKPIGSLSFDPTQPSASGTLEWMPPLLPSGGGGTGVEYTIQASAQGLKPAETRLCVIYLDIVIDYLEQFGSATCTPWGQPTGPTPLFFFSADAHVDNVSCTNIGVVFNIHATDPDHQLLYAFIELENAKLAGGGHTFGKPAANQQQDFSFYAEWSTTDLAGQFPGTQVDITWVAKVAAASTIPGDPIPYHLVFTGPQHLQLNLPVCAEQTPWPFLILRPNMPEDFPRRVPVADADCPAGTYFAPVTSRCIPIQVPASDKGEREQSDGECPAGQTLVCSTGGIMVTCSCE